LCAKAVNISNKRLTEQQEMWTLQRALATLTAKVARLEAQANSSSTGAAEVADQHAGCPDCYVYLRHRADYLEAEFKRWRTSAEQLQRQLLDLTLRQRGCWVLTFPTQPNLRIEQAMYT